MMARLALIARPIPMKRELKGFRRASTLSAGAPDRKAHPDEKGTERIRAGSPAGASTSIARPIPMKRELKVIDAAIAKGYHDADRKAHPDEKGTESLKAQT